jgi:hypothetical protein
MTLKVLPAYGATETNTAPPHFSGMSAPADA